MKPKVPGFLTELWWAFKDDWRRLKKWFSEEVELTKVEIEQETLRQEQHARLRQEKLDRARKLKKLRDDLKPLNPTSRRPSQG